MSLYLVIFLLLCPIILNCKKYLIEVNYNDEETTNKNEIETTSIAKFPFIGADYHQRYDHDGEGIHDLTSLFRSPIEATVRGRKPKKATVKVSDPIEAIVTGRNSIEATMAGSGGNPIEETVTGKVKKIKKGNKLKRMLWR